VQALYVLAQSFERFYQQWKSVGFASILTAWRQTAFNLGQGIIARLETGEIEGIFEDIDETGAIILRTPDGQKRVISAADIFFPNIGA